VRPLSGGLQPWAANSIMSFAKYLGLRFGKGRKRLFCFKIFDFLLSDFCRQREGIAMADIWMVFLCSA